MYMGRLGLPLARFAVVWQMVAALIAIDFMVCVLGVCSMVL